MKSHYYICILSFILCSNVSFSSVNEESIVSDRKSDYFGEGECFSGFKLNVYKGENKSDVIEDDNLAIRKVSFLVDNALIKEKSLDGKVLVQLGKGEKYKQGLIFSSMEIVQFFLEFLIDNNDQKYSLVIFSKGIFIVDHELDGALHSVEEFLKNEYGLYSDPLDKLVDDIKVRGWFLNPKSTLSIL